MQSPTQALQSVLNGTLDIDIAIGDTENYISKTGESSKFLPALRTLRSFRDSKSMDFCGHLRQCMTYYTCGFNITDELYAKLFEHKNLFGFIFQSQNGYSVNITPDILPTVPDLKSTYKFMERRTNMPSVGDGRLYRYYGYTTYTSLSQKTLMYFISNMEKNETILACLPTGGGKSLSWQLSAISNSYQGLIIVVVPTIALAIDHERTSKKIYDNNFGMDSYPLAYYSGIDNEKKKKIYDEVEAGTLPILYISPEALLNKEFQKKLFTAAENGKVSSLIIDEAHLIVNWGIRFRPEFQLLSSFRNRLQSVSTNGLKTILLSATFTAEDTEIIRTIFKNEVFTEYRADELRPEPTYYAHKCDSEFERIDLIKKLVSQAPKPLIVYSVGPDEGKKIYKAIEEMGYKNIALFTGQTKNRDREVIIEEWNNNTIDIIVATSAFGMGVDKADIRTIITAYIPESISRYYQEVGRAGRDGYSSLNYLLTYDEIDNEYVKSLTKGTVLKVDSLVKRWKELLSEAKRETSNTVWIDVNVPPEHLRHTPTGKRNAGWNKDVVLLLYRAGLIEIIDVQNVNAEDYNILIQLNNIRILEDMVALEKYITRFREAERERITDGIDSSRKLLKSENKACYSTYFINEFPFAIELCNGCPYCRKTGLYSFPNMGKIYIESTKIALANDYVGISSDTFTSFLLTSKSIMLSLRESCKDELLCKCIEFLVKHNVNIIIAPRKYDEKVLLEALSYYDNYKYLILTLDEAMRIEIKWLNGVCAAVYTDDESYSQKLYAFTEKYAQNNLNNKIIHIAQSKQYIKSEMRHLSELADQNLSGEQYFLGDGAI